jgi:hypothetical protein
MNLKDYAYALWYIYLAMHPQLSPGEIAALNKEGSELRGKLLLWAEPLAAAGHLPVEAVARIREGSGQKDLASDLTALGVLYRSYWATVAPLCPSVTEADLERAALLGAAIFGLVSSKEQSNEKPNAEGSLRLRRALTKLDRAYFQARRAILYFVQSEEALNEIAPNLRRNPGVSRTRQPAEPAPAPASPTVAAPAGGASDGVVPLVTGGSAPAAGFGSGGSPFSSPKK